MNGRLLTAIKAWTPSTLRRYYRNSRGGESRLNSTQISALLEGEIERITRGSSPIIVGPWLSEVGFEVLYWIPFLNWVQERFNLLKDRVTIISRGGNDTWYRDICTTYIDIFDYFTPTEFKERNAARVKRWGTQKQINIDDFDLEITKRLLSDSEFVLLHPSMMYQMFMPFWGQCTGINSVLDHAEYRVFTSDDLHESLPELPKDYFAAKFYFSDCFPATAENRNFINNILQCLARKLPVVILETGLNVDDHLDWIGGENAQIYSVKKLMDANNNLRIQSIILSRARAFFGTYGGFSYLAPFYGLRSVSFYSNENFLPVHLDVARRAFSSLKSGSFTVLDLKDLDLIRLISA